MKLHTTVIEQLIRLYTNYGGYPEERKLREALTELDLNTYQQQTGTKQTVLVVESELRKYTE